jgi:hypothetical protein
MRIVRISRSTSTYSHRRTLSAAALFLVSLFLVPAVLAGCGDNTNEKRLQADELARAKREGAHQARVEERQREQAREQARLRREIARLKRSSRGGSTAPTGSGSSSPRVAGTSTCGGGLSVGPNTSCAFAANVRDAYAASGGGDTSVTAFSPATGRTYTMFCTTGAPNICTGGNNASVYFP